MSRSGPVHETSTRTVADWRDQAACREHDPELFFPIGQTGPALVQIEVAKRVCETQCAEEIRGACLKWAQDERIPDGVWGGLTEQERDKARRAGSRQRAKQQREDQG